MCGTVLNAFEFFVCVVLCGVRHRLSVVNVDDLCRLRLLVIRDMKAADIVVDLLLVKLGVVVRGSSCVGVRWEGLGVPASPARFVVACFCVIAVLPCFASVVSRALGCTLFFFGDMVSPRSSTDGLRFLGGSFCRR